MSNHPHVSFGNAQKTGKIRTSLLVIESHDHDRAFTFFQILYTAPKLFPVQARHRRLEFRQPIRPKLAEQMLLSLSGPAQAEHRHPASAQHEGRQLPGLTQPTRSQRFERRDHDLLCKVLRGVFVSQVAQAIQPNARSHPAEQFGFSFTVGSTTDSPHQLRVVQFSIHQHAF